MRYKLCRCGGVKEDRSGGTCERCGSGKKRNRKSTTECGYDWQWQQLSVRFRKDNPLCQECERKGEVKEAAEVHHIVPISEAPWLRLSVDNLMSVCVECHRRLDRERRQGASL